MAETWAAASPEPVLYIATCRPGLNDPEMSSRIAVHRARRPIGWTTLEAPEDLPKAIASASTGATLLVDCLTLWVSGLLEEGAGSQEAIDLVARESARLAGALRREGRILIVTNEVGMGIVPATPLGRVFRDAAGLVNTAVAAVADRVLLCVAGLPMVVKGSAKGIPFLKQGATS